MKRILLAAVFMMVAHAALGRRVVARTDENALGKTYFTKVNIWYENPRNIPSTNFHKGGRIPAGTRVKILEKGNHRITFLDEATGLMTIAHRTRHSRVSFEALFDQYFTEEDIGAPGGAIDKLSEKEKAAVKKGILVPGMSKGAVLLAYGYPPNHRTRSLDENKWTYWKDSRNIVVVRFDESGKVTNDVVKDFPADAAAIYNGNRVGRKYLTQVNLWYENRDRIYSINYHDGRMIPIGTPVTITRFGDQVISFTEGHDKKKSGTIIHLTKYSNVGLEDLFVRVFGETSPLEDKGDVNDSPLTPAEIENIKKGKVARGMRKKAVLMAYGYPPGHRTPDLDHHIWVFWLRRAKRMVIYFRHDEVIAIDYP